MRKQLVPSAVILLGLAGCSDLSSTQQRTMTGGLGGAAGGAVIGALAGNAGMGALIGAGAGVAGGYLYDRHKQSEQQAYNRGVQTGRSQATR
jgi:uncharacterized membrane protein